MFVRKRLPEHHLTSESKDVIRLARAVVGTLSARIGDDRSCHAPDLQPERVRPAHPCVFYMHGG
jgi:hypothetical protein